LKRELETSLREAGTQDRENGRGIDVT